MPTVPMALSTTQRLLFIGILVLFKQEAAVAGTVTIDFETFPGGSAIADSTPITTQFPGLAFINTTVITAGISLNEFELPPHSGQNVAFDDGGPISISFATPTSFFSGYFTYYEPLTLAAFDAANNEVVSATSAFSINVACDPGPVCLGNPGSSPNEFLSLTYTPGIVNVTITADPAGSSFVMDDVTFATPTPEPNSIPFLSAALGLLLAAKGQPVKKTIVISAIVIAAALALILHSTAPSTSGTVPPPGIIIWTSTNETAQDLIPLVRSAGGNLIERTPQPLSGTPPDEETWLVGVPTAKTQADTARVMQALGRDSVIRSAELDVVQTLQ